MHIPAAYALRIALVLVLLICVAGAGHTGAQAAPAQFRVYLALVNRAAQSSLEQQVVDLTNQQRRQHGCADALSLSTQLTAAASAHSQDMALHDLFSHTGSNGSTMVSRVVATGYSYSQLAENLAAGPSSAEDVVAGWMSSPGHRANILNCGLHEIGVGYYAQMDDQSNVQLGNGQLGGPFRFYWTQDFGSQ
jgi:uncharacterized protein YkwD